ncbi:hypothetical protein ILYODFUR_035813 [Ilyodon furcidens]|uniref:Uncharacterized protein n=1 Tax=Ilyodon furcidens TaxID=33524 RepID=A0ABV0U0J5_9TELE
MSKPLATKVSIPLSKNILIRPKESIYCEPPLFSSTTLPHFGMEFTRASHIASGILFLSSMTTPWSWWMLETLRSSTFCLRMPYRYPIGFGSGDMLGQHVYLQFLQQGSGHILAVRMRL